MRDPSVLTEAEHEVPLLPATLRAVGAPLIPGSSPHLTAWRGGSKPARPGTKTCCCQSMLANPATYLTMLRWFRFFSSSTSFMMPCS